MISAHQHITLHPAHMLVIHLFITAQTTGLWKIHILPKLPKFLLQYTSSGQTITFFQGLKGKSDNCLQIFYSKLKSLCAMCHLCLHVHFIALHSPIFLSIPQSVAWFPNSSLIQLLLFLIPDIDVGTCYLHWSLTSSAPT